MTDGEKDRKNMGMKGKRETERKKERKEEIKKEKPRLLGGVRYESGKTYVLHSPIGAHCALFITINIININSFFFGKPLWFVQENCFFLSFFAFASVQKLTRTFTLM